MTNVIMRSMPYTWKYEMDSVYLVGRMQLQRGLSLQLDSLAGCLKLILVQGVPKVTVQLHTVLLTICRYCRAASPQRQCYHAPQCDTQEFTYLKKLLRGNFNLLDENCNCTLTFRTYCISRNNLPIQTKLSQCCQLWNTYISFSPSSSVIPCQYHSTVALHIHISSGGWTIGPLVA
jgi:hypothetical protein